MKIPALFCLAVTASVTFAQRPTEWRPSIAEDNKAATWEQTLDFITNTLRFHNGETITGVSSAKRCFLTVEFGPKNNPTSRTFYLNRVDPLSVNVTSSNDGTSFVIEFAGTNNAPYGVVKGLKDDQASFRSIVDTSSLNIDDQELARRTARAFLHAALLCGGKDAISPF